MTEEQVLAAFDALKATHPVNAHAEADAILLTYLEATGHGKIAEAYKQLAKAHGQK